MDVSVNSDRELQQLAEAFDTFNVVSSQLEASYSSLEHRMTELRAQLADAREQRAAASAHKAVLEQRLSSILEALPGGVVVLDEHGCVSDTNRLARSWLAGLDKGAEWSALSSGLFETEFSEHGDLVLRNGKQFVVTRESLAGREQIILLTDVTDQRRVDEVVSRHRRLAGLGEMLATLAHQLRTPITAALLYASNARQPALDDDRRDAMLDKAIACLRDLETLVADMLVFARGNSARGEQIVGIEDLLREVERSVRPHCGAGQHLKFAMPAEDLHVRGNPEVLASAIQNLVVNSLQCAGADAVVSVTADVGSHGVESRGTSSVAAADAAGSGAGGATRSDMRAGRALRSPDDVKRRFAESSMNTAASRSVRIRVEDNGPGVSSADRVRIFEPFFSSRPGGTGLGLAAARSIVRAHRGDIELRQEPGAGACFVVVLPLLDVQRNEPVEAAEGTD